MVRSYRMAVICAFVAVGCGDSRDDKSSADGIGSLGGGDDDGDGDGAATSGGGGGSTSMGLSGGEADGGGDTEDLKWDTRPPDGDPPNANPGDCEAPLPVSCDDASDDPFHAMGLNCPGSIPITNETFTSPDATAWAVARQYGTYIDPGTGDPFWGAREGEKLLFVSSGTISPPDAAGVLTKPGGTFQSGNDQGNPNNVQLPAPIRPQVGSNMGAGGTPFVDCDSVNDCSDTIWNQWTIGLSEAYDLLWFSFDITVPGGTHGYSFDFAWFSAEYPEWVAPEPFNDIGLWWATGETFTGNVTFVNDQPLTVTALADAIHNAGFWGTDPQLANTGFAGMEGFFCSPQNPYGEANCPIGGGTGWFTATGSANPNETITMAFAFFDMGDGVWDSAMLLDNFQWDCEGCDPTLGECGVAPAG